MSNARDITIPFTKMHGLGNDFVVIDTRQNAGTNSFDLCESQARVLADRKLGIGCDQLIVLEPTGNPRAAAFMRIRNADGGEVEACGNAARCVASMLMREQGKSTVTIETVDGLLDARAGLGETVVVDMGPARLEWNEIPLDQARDTLRLPISLGPVSEPCAVSVGNPHAVFFVDDAEAVDVADLGPRLEHHEIFPNRANIEFIHALDPLPDGRSRLRMRVWERGVGITRACGTGACAAAVAACRRGVTGRSVRVELDGGSLDIDWRDDGHVEMAGPSAISFTGRFDAARMFAGAGLGGQRIESASQ